MYVLTIEKNRLNRHSIEVILMWIGLGVPKLGRENTNMQREI